ncbi:MAG: DegV family protein [Dehalococcoidia bacterium]|nr:DegV family protein [Dehalococcoidia bacterium]
MIGTVAVVVDSASYLPAEIHRKYGLLTVPMNVRIGEAEYREFETLDAGTFYAQLGSGAAIATSQPSPGQFVAAYEQARLMGRSGCCPSTSARR